MAATVIRIDTDATRNITGLAGGADGRIAILANVGAFNAVLKDESTSSTAGNRFDIGSDITIQPQGGVILRYDGTLSRWHCIGSWLGAPGSVTPTAITVANEATDTTCFLSFFTAATGDLGPKTNSALAFNSNTGVLTLTSDPIIPDEAYDATNWNGSLEPPTKNAVRDKIEDILDGVTFTGDVVVPDEAYDATNWNGSLEVPTKNAIRDKIESMGGGDVVGPASATDLAIARYDGTTGKLIQDSGTLVGDNGAISSYVSDAVTNSSATALLTLLHNSSGTPAAGFGGTVQLRLDSATVEDRTALDAVVEWVDATDASRKAKFRLYAWDTASRECLAIAASGSAAQIGFLGSTPSAKLSSPDLGTLATTFGLASGTPTFGAANLTGDVALARLSKLSYIVLQEQQTSGTNGGTFTSGAWRTRVLNTEVVDSNSECSLSSNQFTLTAGTYEIHAMAPAGYCGNHQAKLYNATDASDILIGPNVKAQATLANGDAIMAHVIGAFTIGASKALEIQHRCQTTRATDGFGVATSWGTEVYCTVLLRRIA